MKTVHLDQILESQKFMFVFEGNGGGAFAARDPIMGVNPAYGSGAMQEDTRYARDLLDVVAPNMPLTTIRNDISPALYIPPEIVEPVLLRKRDPLVSNTSPLYNEPEPLQYQEPFQNFKPFQEFLPEPEPYFDPSILLSKRDKYLDKSDPIIGQRESPHNEATWGYDYGNDVHLHLHGRDDDHVEFGHLKKGNTHILGTRMNGYEASMAAHYAEDAGIEKYAMHKPKQFYGDLAIQALQGAQLLREDRERGIRPMVDMLRKRYDPYNGEEY